MLDLTVGLQVVGFILILFLEREALQSKACLAASSRSGIPTEQREHERCLQSLETVIFPVEVKSNMAG